MMTDEQLTRTATYSDCRLYRYTLSHTWGPGPRIGWLMLNPSSATEHDDDRTVAKCGRLARRWGYGGMEVRNLFAYRATDPNAMRAIRDPVGERKNDAIIDMVIRCELVVCAWGNHGEHMSRSADVMRVLSGFTVPLRCLTVTKTGQPGHPLYVPEATELREWRA